MSTLTNLGGRLPPGPGGVPGIPANGLPAGGPSVTVASYDEYAAAQRSVDFLSDNGFPVEQTAIVGTDLRLVETVLGRLTTGRAALAGAASGAWFGVLIGLLLGIFSVSAWWRVLVAAIVIATAWGAIFGAIAHAATGGRRDFSSRTSLQANHYAINVGVDHAEHARQLLTRMNWQASMATPDGQRGDGTAGGSAGSGSAGSGSAGSGSAGSGSAGGSGPFSGGSADRGSAGGGLAGGGSAGGGSAGGGSADGDPGIGGPLANPEPVEGQNSPSGQNSRMNDPRPGDGQRG